MVMGCQQDQNNFFFPILFFFLVVLILCTYISFVVTDDEREWDYIEGSGKGPEDWGDLNENWTICKTGIRQSPINFWGRWVDVVTHLGRLETRYKPANATLMNRGHDIMVKKKQKSCHFFYIKAKCFRI